MRTPPPTIRRHAIFKRHYRRAVAASPEFHNLEFSARWALLRAQVVADVTPSGVTLLQTLDSRESRRDEVLTKLEEARQTYAR